MADLVDFATARTFIKGHTAGVVPEAVAEKGVKRFVRNLLVQLVTNRPKAFRTYLPDAHREVRMCLYGPYSLTLSYPTFKNSASLEVSVGGEAILDVYVGWHKVELRETRGILAGGSIAFRRWLLVSTRDQEELGLVTLQKLRDR